MKLLRCGECKDIFNLKEHQKTCSCGRTSGRYVGKRLIEISGPCQVYGLGNTMFAFAAEAALFKIQEPHQYIRRL